MIFIEIRCEDSAEEYAYGEHEYAPRCYSHDNRGCGAFGHESVDGVLAAKREMDFNAKASGWKNIRNHGWVCPHCVGERQKLSK